MSELHEAIRAAAKAQADDDRCQAEVTRAMAAADQTSLALLQARGRIHALVQQAVQEEAMKEAVP